MQVISQPDPLKRAALCWRGKLSARRRPLLTPTPSAFRRVRSRVFVGRFSAFAQVKHYFRSEALLTSLLFVHLGLLLFFPLLGPVVVVLVAGVIGQPDPGYIRNELLPLMYRLDRADKSDDRDEGRPGQRGAQQPQLDHLRGVGRVVAQTVELKAEVTDRNSSERAVNRFAAVTTRTLPAETQTHDRRHG